MTPVKTPINIHKEAPLMVVILIVRHCEKKSVAVLVVILMCDGFDQKSVTLTLLMAILLYVTPLTKIVWPFWPKSLSREIRYYNHIALKFDNLSSAAAEVPFKFQSDWKSLNPKLTASILHEILQ